MRYINGWVVSLVLRRKARDFFHISAERMEQMKKTGFYIIKKVSAYRGRRIKIYWRMRTKTFAVFEGIP